MSASKSRSKPHHRSAAKIVSAQKWTAKPDELRVERRDGGGHEARALAEGLLSDAAHSRHEQRPDEALCDLHRSERAEEREEDPDEVRIHRGVGR